MNSRPLAAEHEVGGADQAEAGPEVVELERLAHVEEREWNEHGERDDLLDDLQLRQAERLKADPVRRHLQEIFEQRDRPADDRRDVPGAGEDTRAIRGLTFAPTGVTNGVWRRQCE